MGAYLNSSVDASGVHATGYVDSIAPDVIEQLCCSDNSGCHLTKIVPNLHLELKAQHVAVELIKFLQQVHREIHQSIEMRFRIVILIPCFLIQPRSSHQTRPYGFYFLDIFIFLGIKQLLEVAHQFIQDTQKLSAPFICLVVEVIKVGYLGKDDSHIFVCLRVALVSL